MCIRDSLKAVQQAAGRAEKAAERLEALAATVEAKTDQRAAEQAAQARWETARAVGWVLLPVGMLVVALAVLWGGLWSALGLGPVFTWLWSGFAGADAWWSKGLYGLGAVALLAGVVWGVWRGTLALLEAARDR